MDVAQRLLQILNIYKDNSERGWFESGLAIYLRSQLTSDALAAACTAELGEATGFYAHSANAALWDHIELGEEHLIGSLKPQVYECTESGRQLLENARGFCKKPYGPYLNDISTDCKVVAFEASRDDHRRFALVTAVVMSGPGQVIFYDHGTIRTSDNNLDASAHNGLEFPVQAVGSGGDYAGSWAIFYALCSMFAEVHKEKEGVRLVNLIMNRVGMGLKACKNQLETLEKSFLATWIPSRDDLRQIHRSGFDTRSLMAMGFDMTSLMEMGFDMSSLMEPGLVLPSPGTDPHLDEVQYIEGNGIGLPA